MPAFSAAIKAGARSLMVNSALINGIPTPAIWMLPTSRDYGKWPHSGEIDIMENVGYLPDSVFGTIQVVKHGPLIKHFTC